MNARVRAAVVIVTLSLAGITPAAAGATAFPVVSGAASGSPDLTATTSVAVAGHYAYSTAYHAGELTAVDITHPVAPVVAGHSASTPALTGGSNVAISGGYAFVVSKNRNASTSSNDDGSGNSLTILDVHTDPANPAVVGTLRSTTQLFGAYGIAVSGNYAYVAYQGLISGQPTSPDSGTGGLSVIDISAPGSPKIVANLDNGTLPAPWTGQNLFDHSTSVALSGTVAYVTAFYSDRITAVDVSNPLNPRILGSLADTANMNSPADVVVSGHDAYVADQTGGASPQLTVVDVSDPASPRVVGTLSNSVLGGAYRIRVHGDFAYLAGSSADALSAVDITDPAAPRLAGWITDTRHLHRATGVDVDPTGAEAVLASPYLSSESNATFPPYPLQSGGPPNTGTISVVTLDPLPIEASINTTSAPRPLTTQRSATLSFAVNDAVSAVQCRLDSAALGPCTSPTSASYANLALGAHTFTVQATDAAGRTSTATYRWTVGAAPGRASAPSIVGSPQQGRRLRATSSFTGVPGPTLRRQWQRCNARGRSCQAIRGANRATYTPGRADIGHRLRVLVTATNALGSASARSAATAVVSPGYTVAMSITGVAAGRPALRATIRIYPRGAGMTRVTITLPAGLRFASLRAVTIVDGHGRRVAATASRHHGSLVIVLAHSAPVVTVTVPRGSLSVSAGLRAKVRKRHRVGANAALVVRNARAQVARMAVGLVLR